MAGKTNCESCNNFVFDDESECWVCEKDLDEDEMGLFLRGSYADCPYYRSDDDYETARKQ